MGTSKDYAGGKGGDWTPYRYASTSFVKKGGGERADRLLARYVGALGGAIAAAASGTGAVLAPAQGLAGIGVGLAQRGLSPTLEELGLSHLVGADRYEVLDGLLDALAGDGSTLGAVRGLRGTVPRGRRDLRAAGGGLPRCGWSDRADRAVRRALGL